MSENNTEFQSALNIITNQNIFGDRTKNDLEFLRSFEFDTGMLSKFYNSDKTFDKWNDEIRLATHISQDVKWEIEEMWPEILLLKELKAFAQKIKLKTSQS